MRWSGGRTPGRAHLRETVAAAEYRSHANDERESRFSCRDGAIINPGLVGKTLAERSVVNPNPNGLYALCGDCSPSGGGITAPAPGRYYPGPSIPLTSLCPRRCPSVQRRTHQSLSTCRRGLCSATHFMWRDCIASTSIQCAYVASTTNRDLDTVQAAGCLIHYNGAVGDSDSIDLAATPIPPFEFLGGNQNPVAGAVGQRCSGQRFPRDDSSN